VTVGCNHRLYICECGMIGNRARGVCQVMWPEFRHHESPRGSIVFTSQAIIYSRSKSEPWIVVSMSKNDYRTETHLLAALKTTTNELRSDALASMSGNHSHWPEPHYS
jgi:hypothetical protein